MTLVKDTSIHSGIWDRILGVTKFLSITPSLYLPHAFLFLQHLLCHCLDSELHHLLPGLLSGLLTHISVFSYHSLKSFPSGLEKAVSSKILTKSWLCIKSGGFPHPLLYIDTALQVTQSLISRIYYWPLRWVPIIGTTYSSANMLKPFCLVPLHEVS